MVQIFEVQLFGEEVEKYCKMTKEEKKDFIKLVTAQTDDAVIDDFISKPLVHSDGKACCGGHKHLKDASIAKTNAGSVVEPDTIGKNQAKNNGTDTKGSGSAGKGNKAK